MMARTPHDEAARRKGVAILPVDSEHNAFINVSHGRRRKKCAAYV